jgi:hypothetical protein
MSPAACRLHTTVDHHNINHWCAEKFVPQTTRTCRMALHDLVRAKVTIAGAVSGTTHVAVVT